jgi:hypothetical protein
MEPLLPLPRMAQLLERPYGNYFLLIEDARLRFRVG